MTHPLALHAITALWSLRQAWVEAERASRTAWREAASADRGTLQAWRPGPGRSGSGGHADIIGSLFDDVGPSDAIYRAASRYSELMAIAQDHVAQVRYLVAGEVGVSARSLRSVRSLGEQLGHVRRPVTVEVRRWLEGGDRHIRTSLDMEPSIVEMPGSPECPSCTVRMLRLHTAAPAETARTVVCGAGCRCRGEVCPCGMPDRMVGDSHIWAYGTLPQAMPTRRRRGRIAA